MKIVELKQEIVRINLKEIEILNTISELKKDIFENNKNKLNITEYFSSEKKFLKEKDDLGKSFCIPMKEKAVISSNGFKGYSNNTESRNGESINLYKTYLKKRYMKNDLNTKSEYSRNTHETCTEIDKKRGRSSNQRSTCNLKKGSVIIKYNNRMK